MVDRNRVEDQMDGMLSEFTGVDTTPAPEQKGLSYGQLLIDNIVGLDNGYDSFGEKFGRAFNDDEVGFLTQAGISAWEGAKQFVSHPIQTTEEVATDIKDSVVRLGSEDLDARLQRMYGVDYTQATDEQVNQAREAVFGDALEAANLIPAGGAALKLGRTASRTGVAADVIGSTKALASGDLDFLGGTPTPRANTAGLSAQVSAAAPARVNPLFTPRPDGGLRGYHSDIGSQQAGSIVADFYSPARSVLETVDIPNKGLKGSEAIKLLRNNPDVRQSEIDTVVSGIDPLKRYTREELLSDFDRTSYVVTAERPSVSPDSLYAGSSYEHYDMQRQDLNNTEELDYQETILRAQRPEGTPGFLASMGTHHTDDTIAHLRTSIQQDIDTGQKFYLIEEIQSDLVARGPRKARGEVDFSTGFLDEADVRIRAISGAKFMSQGLRRIYKAERDFLKEYALARAAEYTDAFRQMGRGSFGPDDPEYLSKSEDFLGKYANGPRSEHSRDVNNAAYDYLVSQGYDANDAMYAIESTQNVSQEILAKPVEDITRAISEAPIRDEAEVVRLALQTSISDAITSQVPRVVIPNLERILEQRFRVNSAGFANGLEPNSGFYKTYVTGVNKAIEQLQQELPEMAVRSQNLPHRTGSSEIQGSLPNTATVLDLSAYVGQDMSRLRFAEGGLATETQMNRLMAEGGLNYDGMRVDPVSGNEVPPGSLPEEVRDDIDAKLSEGEYVVPADVLRFYGVKFFEGLRANAKSELAQMDQEGRIGGDPVPEMGMEMEVGMAEGGLAKMPSASVNMSVADDTEMLIDQFMDIVKADKSVQDKLRSRGMAYYQGGMVTAKDITTTMEQMINTDKVGFADGGVVDTPTFNPANYGIGFSLFGNQEPMAPTANIEIVEYINAQGQSLMVRVQDGQPIDAVPEGYFPKGSAPEVQTQQSSNNNDRDRLPVTPTVQTASDRQREPAKDFYSMSAEELAKEIETTSLMGRGATMGSSMLLSGPIGLLAGGAAQAFGKGRMLALGDVASELAQKAREAGDIEGAAAYEAVAQSTANVSGIGADMARDYYLNRWQPQTAADLLAPKTSTTPLSTAIETPTGGSTTKSKSSDGGSRAYLNNDSDGGAAKQAAANAAKQAALQASGSKSSNSKDTSSKSSSSTSFKSSGLDGAKAAASKQGTTLAKGGRATGGLVTRRK